MVEKVYVLDDINTRLFKEYCEKNGVDSTQSNFNFLVKNFLVWHLGKIKEQENEWRKAKKTEWGNNSYFC